MTWNENSWASETRMAREVSDQIRDDVDKKNIISYLSQKNAELTAIIVATNNFLTIKNSYRLSVPVSSEEYLTRKIKISIARSLMKEVLEDIMQDQERILGK